ncbi:ankyrin repeat-containing domain protein [Aspergillus californicus]
MSLITLPPDVLIMIWDNLDTQADRNAFTQISRQIHTDYNIRLYQRAVYGGSTEVLDWAIKDGSGGTAQRVFEAGLRLSRAAAIMFSWRAAMRGQETILRVLMDNGGDVTSQFSNQEPLLLAIQTQWKPNDKHYIPAVNEDSPMVKTDFPGVIRLLLQHGADINASNNRTGLTPLMFAAICNHTKMVDILLANGATVDLASAERRDALWYAVDEGHITLVDRLADAITMQPNKNINQCSPLVVAALHGNVDIVNLLLAKGADPNFARKDQYTPAAVAIEHGFANVLEALLEHGLSPDTSISRAPGAGRPLLAAAVDRGDDKIVRLLLARGATVQSQGTNDCNLTSLMFAVRHGRTDLVQKLLAAGADVQARLREVETPLYQACMNGHLGIVLLLTKHGSDRSKPLSTQTLLAMITKNRDLDIVRLLMYCGSLRDLRMDEELAN